MKIHLFSILMLFLLIAIKSGAQDYKITVSNQELTGNKLYITFQIDCKNLNDKFRISIEVKKQNGEPIVPKSISGDLGDNIKPGNNKIIVWDLEQDTIYLNNEEISLEVFCEKQIKYISKGSIVLMSVVLPGLGQSKMTGKPWWIGGVAAYGALAGGFVFHKSCLDSYEQYKAEKTNASDRAELWDQVQKQNSISNIFFISAASIWVSNLIWVSVTPNTNEPRKHAGVYLRPMAVPCYKGALVSLKLDF